MLRRTWHVTVVVSMLAMLVGSSGAANTETPPAGPASPCEAFGVNCTIVMTQQAGGLSHVLMMASIGNELASRGHRVIYLIPHHDRAYFPAGDMVPMEFTGGWRDLGDVSAHILGLAGLGPVDTILYKADTAGRETAAFLASGVLQRLKEREPVVDLVLADYEHPLGRVLRELTGARLATVFFTPLGALMPFTDYPPQYSSRVVYGSGLTAAELTSSLLARVNNLVTGELFRWLLFPKVHNAVADALEQACEKRTEAMSVAAWCPLAPGLAASLRADAGCSLVRGSLFLSPAFHPFDMPLPLPPTIKYIGPVLAAPGRPLPEPLASFLAAGPTVLFSAGTYVRYTVEQTQGAAQALQRIQAERGLQVIVKNKAEYADSAAVLANFASPVFLVTEWVPQNDVLAHPNCTLFVSHGGFNGVTEAAYHGVPTVVIPSLGDQVDNAFRVVDMGLGVRVPLSQLSARTLYAALTTVLDSDSYRAAGARLSRIVKTTGGYKEGADWVEYALATDGAQHLVPRQLWDYTWLQRTSLDVALVLAASTLGACALALACARCTVRWLGRRCRPPAKAKLE